MTEEWNDEREQLLRTMWEVDGLSARECGAALGVTRNAVIGKVHRLKLQKHGPTPKMPASKVRALKSTGERGTTGKYRGVVTAARKARMAKAIPAPPPEVFSPAAEDLAVGAWNPLPGATPIGLMDLSDKVCRWPVSDGAPFLFCGCATAEGSSYCPTHKHIGAGKGTVGEQNAVKAAKGAAKQDRNHKAWLEAA